MIVDMMSGNNKSNVSSAKMDKDQNPPSAGSSGSNLTQEFLPGFKGVDDFIKAGYRAVLEMTKTSNTLPNEDHFHYYSSYPSFEDAMAKQGTQSLRSISNVIQCSGVKGNILRRDLEEKFELLLDANDTLLERVATSLDEVAGIRKNPENETPDARKVARPLSGTWNQSPSSPSIHHMMKSPTVSPAMRKSFPKVVGKPQFNFPDKIDNTPKPFEPIIKEKPHSLKPLSTLLMLTDYGECYSHPYEYELDMFNPPEHQLTAVEPKKPRTEQTPLKYVETVQDLNSMLQHLKNYKEVAIDLEHHNYRSFQGFTCLMQISSRHTDFIVDTLKLRGELQILNEVFADPKIVKVLHGADSDVEWLQRDFGLYLVNMFDTHQAGKLLNFPRVNLAYLVKYYCNFDLDKSYQLADWRIRPLTTDMIEYARMDTHFLLYIYDRLKNDLWELGMNSDRLIRATHHQSTQICKKIYVKPQLTNEAHLKLYQKSRKMFNNRQLWAMKEIYAWRFTVAMNEDESIPFVLPNHMLLQIAESLPRELQGILACCNPIPYLVRQNLTAIHRIVLQAREQPLIQTETTEDDAARKTQTEWTKINIESSLHCPHQLPQKDEQPDSLPTLLGVKKLEVSKVNGILKPSATIAVFSAFGQKVSGMDMNQKVLSPYQRYLLVKPYMQHLANVAAIKETEANQQKPAKTATVAPPMLQRMEQIQMHFEQLDSRTAAQMAPPPREVESDGEEEEDANQNKQEEGEVDEQEDLIAFSEPPSKRARIDDGERIKSFRPGKKNLSVNDARSNFERNRNKNHKKNKFMGNRGQHHGSGGPSTSQEYHQGPNQPFNYNQVDFNRFQGGSKFNNKKQKFHNNRGRGNKKNRFNFPQRQNQKSHTYKT